jgi:hypothetical protein
VNQSPRIQPFRLILRLLVIVLFCMGMGQMPDCGTKPTDAVPEMGTSQCKNSYDLGSSITSRSVCAAKATSAGCKGWGFFAEECVCCR